MKRTKKHTTKSRSIFIFALVLLMAAFLATPDSVLAQTPLKVFVNADGDTVFVLNEDGGFNAGQLGNLDSQGTTSVALGSFPTASGDQAVAIGAVSQAVGTNAVALGAAKAQGDFSAAMGAGPEASGEGSIALGFRTDATGKYATSMGFETRASGIASTTMGHSTSAGGDQSTAMGDRTVASGDHSVAIGLRAKAVGPEAVSLGHITTAEGGQSVAMGFRTAAIGTRSVAFGGHSIASSIATGLRAEAIGPETVSLGHITTAEGGQSVAMGFKTAARGVRSVAMGDHTTASGRSSVAMGRGTLAQNDQEAVFGRFNTTLGNSLFVVGNGGSVTNRSNALALTQNGDLEIAGSLRESSDRRLKKEIEPLGTNVVEKLAQIRPVRFHFKESIGHPSNTQIGLLAQEVRKQFPELVSEGSNGYLSLSYTKFTAVLLKGIQEQQAGIEKLQAKIRQSKQLEERLAKLETNRQHGKMVLTRSSVYTPLMLLLLIFVGGTIVFRAFPKKYKSKG